MILTKLDHHYIHMAVIIRWLCW